MGVPSFYRWLVGKYPKIAVNAVEDREEKENERSPNGVFHNLYLDMNGIIHPCFHPEDEVLFPPTTYDQVFLAVFDHIDRIFRMVRPTRLVFLALDGVAPRAKMNQQRARRFRAAKDAEIAEEEEERLRRQYKSQGKTVLPKKESLLGDSNVITPGTVFMQKMASALEYYIRLRLNSHPGWKNVKVILSDSNVPGEGEHKIMAYIRQQRSLPGYDPNTKHCLYGSDADLIMLGLASHEIHFSILREHFLRNNAQQEISFSSLEANLSKAEFDKIKSRPWVAKVMEKCGGSPPKPHQFLNIWTLREYLKLELRIPESSLGFEIDIERVVDDFVFICFFAGNDFLPRMPSIDIHEGALDLLIHVYKTEFISMRGYLVDTSLLLAKEGGYMNVKRLETFVLAVGKFEQKIFAKRENIRQRNLKRILRERNASVPESENLQEPFYTHPTVPILGSEPLSEEEEEEVIVKNTRELLQTLKTNLRGKGDLFNSGSLDSDEVKLGHPGWENRYYQIKFHVETMEDIINIRKDVVGRYTEGLCWILHYYYAGVCSWDWFYPYHYGPFASDMKMKDLSLSTIKFRQGVPFKPFDQLMAVLPPRSSHALPESYRSLMTSGDSPILDLYPFDFEVDAGGKRFSWQAVVKLPFINEEPLVKETGKLERFLLEDENARNKVTEDLQLSRRSDDDCNLPKRRFQSVVSGKDDIEDDRVICTDIKNQQPDMLDPRILHGVDVPLEIITVNDLAETSLWHNEHQGCHQMRSTNVRRSSGDRGPPANGVFKGSGSGWGGRGRGSSYQGSSNMTTRIAGRGGSYQGSSANGVFKGSGWGGRGRGRGRGSSYQGSSNFHLLTLLEMED